MNLDALNYLKKYRPEIYNEYIRYTKRDEIKEGKYVILLNGTSRPGKIEAIRPKGTIDIILSNPNDENIKFASPADEYWKYMALVEKESIEEERDNHYYKKGQFREDYEVDKTKEDTNMDNKIKEIVEDIAFDIMDRRGLKNE